VSLGFLGRFGKNVTVHEALPQLCRLHFTIRKEKE
jgi:hypothetical protein